MIQNGSIIITKMQADRMLALRLDRALQGVKKQLLEQAENLEQGITRLLFYSSCFTDNYQDVCAQQKQEDTRFLEGLVQLVKHRDIIHVMVEIYVEQIMNNLDSSRISNIQRSMMKMGSSIATSSLTNQSFSGLITAAICYSTGMSFSVDSKLSAISAIAVTAAGMYGRVQLAANAANRLKIFNSIYYQALYSQELEMMYFLIEPVMSRNDHFSILMASDDEIASAIMRLIN
ncbi:hypothetical protein N5923_06720 [Erwiniaceae bacterium BAC15a-03b]|uniref:Uncharacterized protein n=1 Tax=Winslowiella arboricola TaxID=2978220 RepID=A0A9J6PFW3_9GAMM|nr:hypothetical protein [Winslowiella arboricola]MCU5771363.1 hypothetical protein [Winslowiella arboricola]MCU5777185.1 hypothetical protein [Winslowiella arboricola]